MARRAAPVRTCVGCRGRAASADLLRVVAVGGVLVPDPRRRLPGRGAHLHLDQQCLDLAERRQAFRRALRGTGSYDTTRLRAHLAQAASPQQFMSSETEAGRPDERSMSTQP